jgi:four helix bundle protein
VEGCLLASNKGLPHVPTLSEQEFRVVSQMRRAAVSITANVAEGYGRFSYQENIQFCRHSRGSLCEMRDHFTTALDAGYITQEEHEFCESQALFLLKLINGYIRATKERKARLEPHS